MDKQELALLIKMIVENTGGDVEFRNSYGGRSMYGNRCIGIVGSHSDCMAVVGEVIKECHDRDIDFFGSVIDTLMDFDRDSMGRDTIYYWQDIEAIEDTADIDQDD